jgi:hypothetical protein
MLTTSASLVAFDMYTELGYSTLATFDRGIKRLTNKVQGKTPALKLRAFKQTDAKPLDAAFASHTANALGFVFRQPEYLAMRVKTLQTSAERIKVATVGNRIVGYSLLQHGGVYTEIQELIAIDHSSRLKILEAVGRQPKARWLICTGLCDRNLSNLYTTHGFHMYKSGWGRIMATCIDGTLKREEIAQLYGIDDGRFVISALDSF